MTRRTVTGFTNYLGGLVLACGAMSAQAAGPELQTEVLPGSVGCRHRAAAAQQASCGSARLRSREHRAVRAWSDLPREQHLRCGAARRQLDGRRGGARLRRLCARHPRLRRLDPTRLHVAAARSERAVCRCASKRCATLARRWTSSWRGAVSTQLTLIGWSWGTTTTAAFTAGNPGRVGKLVLVSPVWLGVQPPALPGRLSHQHPRRRARFRTARLAEGARRRDRAARDLRCLVGGDTGH